MHKEAHQFVASVKRQSPEFFAGTRVLEVGSLIINGTIRGLFEKDCDYRGIDIAEGYGVDRVCHVTELVSTRPYDVVVSTEMLEHDSLWQESLRAMYDHLRDGGLLIITCAAPNRPEHGTIRVGSPEASPSTADHYRNISTEDFASVLPASLFERSYLGYRGNKDDLYFAGIKREQFGKQYQQYTEQYFEAMDARTKLKVGEDGRWYLNGELLPVVFAPQMADITGSLSLDKRILPRFTVTAEISTKDRYHMLPLTLAAIINQTHKPNWIAIYDDGEQKDLREVSPFNHLLQLANDLGINWTFYSTERKGQVANHQHALDNATTDLIWRLDDDEIPEPNCLENLLAEMKDGVGAVAGLVHHLGGVPALPDSVQGGLEDITHGTNLQWFSFNSGPREVEHLYSTFLYSVEAAKKAGGYPRELSPIGHREESWFTIRLKQAGYKLIVTPNAKTYHLRESTGGIRSFSDASLWEHDDQMFQEYLKTLKYDGKHLVILDSGLGDHLLFRALLVDEFKRKYPDRQWLLAVCYVEPFEGIDNVTIISIAEAKLMVGDRYMDYSVYQWAWDNGRTGPIIDTMREFYGRE